MGISDRVKHLREHGYGLDMAKRIEKGETLTAQVSEARGQADLKGALLSIIEDVYPKVDPEFMKARAGMMGADR